MALANQELWNHALGMLWNKREWDALARFRVPFCTFLLGLHFRDYVTPTGLGVVRNWVWKAAD